MNKQEAIELAESMLRKEHDFNDEDSWYSCPQHPNYLGYLDRMPIDQRPCYCGFHEHNKKVNQLISYLKSDRDKETVY